MNRTRTLTAFAAAGLLAGGTFVGIAAAEPPSTTDEAETAVVQQAPFANGGLLQVQDAPTPDGDAPAEGPRQGRRGHRGHRGAGVAAEAIGIEADDLRARIEAGETIAEVAEAEGVEPQAVIDAVVEAKEARIDAKVEAGRITAEEAAEKLADLNDRVTDRVFGTTDEAAAPTAA